MRGTVTNLTRRQVMAPGRKGTSGRTGNLMPLGVGSVSVVSILGSAGQMATGIEGVVDGSVDGKKALG